MNSRYYFRKNKFIIIFFIFVTIFFIIHTYFGFREIKVFFNIILMSIDLFALLNFIQILPMRLKCFIIIVHECFKINL